MPATLLMRPGRTTRRLLVASTAALVAAIPMLSGTPAAHSAADPSCPDAFPTADVTRGQPVNGLTVSTGTTPEQFTGSIIGVLDDAVAPGLDLIMARLTSSEIDRVGGIWQGMSGSPVYSEDGRLIGAVSYGFPLGPSPVAGITPAEDMQALLSSQPSAAAARQEQRLADGRDKVALPQGQSKSLVAAGDASQAQVAAGLTRLPLPLNISGMASQRRLNQVVNRLGLHDVRAYRGSAAPTGSAAPSSIVPGGNLAATVSQGDVTVGGLGTATAVCGNEVIAFGHPANWTGPSTMAMHSADALFIQEDPTLAPFKMGNLGGITGTITSDRMAGIAGVLGTTPSMTRVGSDVAVDTGGTRHGVTTTSVPDAVPDIAAFHLLANEDRVFDGIGAGSSLVRWTVQGTRGSGVPFEYVRTNRYASPEDITFESIFELYDQLFTLKDNRFTDLHIDRIYARASLSREVRQFQLSKVERRQGAAWVPVTHRAPLQVRPGETLRLRVTLTSFRNELGSRTAIVSVTAPAGIPRGSDGYLEVLGGSSAFDESPPAASFNQLLSQLANATRNDQLLARLILFPPRGGQVERTTTTQLGAVAGGGRLYDVVVH